jgi:uncharacterized membrane protein YeiH
LRTRHARRAPAPLRACDIDADRCDAGARLQRRGAQIAQAMSLPALTVIVMGVITGTFGGLVRDVLTNEIPFILSRGELYATAAIAGVAAHLVLLPVLPSSVAALAGMTVIVALRFAAIFWQLRLPVFTLRE